MKIVYLFFLNIVLTAALFMPAAQAQSPLYHEFLIKLKPGTSMYQIIDSLPGVRFINTGLTSTAIDRVGGRFFFAGLDSANVDRLYTVDVHTGQILHSPAVQIACANDNFGQLAYDDSNGLLYGIHWSTCDQKEYFISINENTGAINNIDSIPGVMYIATDIFTYDQTGHRYFFSGVAASTYLYSIDALTGHVLSAPPVPAGLNQMQYDNANGTLYGICNDTNFVKIDPLNGDTTIIGHVPITGFFAVPTYQAFDEAHQLFITAGEESSAQAHLLSIRTADASLSANPTFASGTNNGANIIEIRYDDNDSTLYALHWGPEEATYFNTSYSKTICSSGSYLFGDSVLTQAGVYCDSLTSVSGYDSVVTLTLITTNVFYDSIFATICGGSIFIFGNDSLTQGGTYVDTLTAQGGCDSIIVLTLTVNNSYSNFSFDTICSGTSYSFYGNTLTDSGIYIYTLHTVHGCDSTIILDLAVRPSPVVTFTWDSMINENIVYQIGLRDSAYWCEWGIYNYRLSGGLPSGGAYSGLYVVNDSLQFPNNYRIGMDTITYTYTDLYGCDGSISRDLFLTVCEGINDIAAAADIHLYPDPNNGAFTLQTSNSLHSDYIITDMLGHIIEQKPVTSGTQLIDIADASAGMYTLTVRGAQSSRSLRFVVMK